MKRFIGQLGLILFLAGVLIPFNNCGYQGGDSGQNWTNSESVVSIRPRLTAIQIPNNFPGFTMDGACDPAFYPETLIFWTIQRKNGTQIFDSYSAGGMAFTTSCSPQETFQIQVKLPCPGVSVGSDGCYGILEPLDLILHIQGIDSTGNVADQKSSIRVALNPPAN